MGKKFPLKRRQFLILGVGGAAVLTIGALTARYLVTQGRTGPAEGYRVLRVCDRALLAVLTPAILKGVIPEGGIERALHLTDEFLATQGASSIRDFYRLGETLSIFHSWDGWSTEDADAFLTSYRTSWIGMKNQIYRSLTQLVTMPWYAQPDAWKAIGYPGPPRL